MTDPDPITQGLARLRWERLCAHADRAPRVLTGQGGTRYYVGPCTGCGEPETYQHLAPVAAAPSLPLCGASWRELAWCEACGVVEPVTLLCLQDGSVRALDGST